MRCLDRWWILRCRKRERQFRKPHFLTQAIASGDSGPRSECLLPHGWPGATINHALLSVPQKIGEMRLFSHVAVVAFELRFDNFLPLLLLLLRIQSGRAGKSPSHDSIPHRRPLHRFRLAAHPFKT